MQPSIATGAHNFASIERVVFGQPAAGVIAAEAARLGSRRVFIVASRTLRTQTGVIREIETSLGERHAATFDGIPQHTTRGGMARATPPRHWRWRPTWWWRWAEAPSRRLQDGDAVHASRHVDERLEALDRFEVKLGEDGKPVRPVFDGPCRCA